MQKILSPNQFLFEQAILEVLKQAKKHIRIAPFETIQPQGIYRQNQELIKANNGNLYLQLYHHYLVSAMTNPKTKQLVCIKYQKVLRQNLFDRDHLPPQMVSSILSACSNPGGSTTGSSHGSTNISTSSQQNQNLYVVNLIKTILLKTHQPSSQIQLALTYILQGTRNKRYNTFYNSILEEIYNTLLIKIRQQPIKRLVRLELNHLINEIEYHVGINDQKKQWMNRNYDQNGKKVLCIHDQRGGKGKFGKCFLCAKEADNYCKDQMVPICSFDCKYKLKQIVDCENNNDYFNLMGWLIESLSSGDEIIYSFLGRELPHHCLSLSEIVSILKIIINVFTLCSAQRLAQHNASIGQQNPSSSGHYVFKQIEKHALNIFLHILFNYKHLYEKELSKYFKVYFFQIVRIMQLISIKRFKLDAKTPRSKGQLPASKETLESNLNLSFDSMGNMQSLNSLTQNNPNVASYLNYQQQFSNPFLNGIIQILSNEDLFFYIYSNFDCKFFQQNLLAKMMNIISQYAKQEIISKEFGVGITGSSAYGVYSILKMLTERVVGYEKHKNLRNFNLEEENESILKFLHKYPINQTEVDLKRQLPKIIEIFNKKPIKGITALKKLFSKPKTSSTVQDLPLSQSTIRQSKAIQQSQQVISRSNIQQKDFERDVEEIKKRAQRLERQNLQSSQVSAREEDKNISIDNIDESIVVEKQPKEQFENEIKQQKVEQTMAEKQEHINAVSTQQVNQKQKPQIKSIKEEQVIKKQEKSQNKSLQLQSWITPKQIAILLRQNVDYDSKLKKIPLFHKQKIAEYLGSTKNPEATLICSQFFKLDEPIYQNLQIDDSLRVEFNYFGLPKQGQQIQIVIDQLSKVMLPHTYFTSGLHIFQYIYTLLMVQSGHNPNVKQSDKVKLEMFLSMVNHITEAKDKAERDYHRIKKNSLNNLFNWGEMIFDHKYLMNVKSEDWLFEKLEQANNTKPNDRKIVQNKSIVNLKWLMQYIWEYVYISIVNNQKKNSTLGVFEAIVLYGKYGLVGQQFGFMQIFKRSYQYNKSKQSLQSLLRLGIQFNNYIYQWSYLINLSYSLEQSNTYHEHIDKIFTNLQFVHKSKLKIFLVALCEFSTSEYKSDKGYNRELFVLRHITEILEYNLHRLQDVWDEIWGTIEVYFKGICLHPKKQISMAAIDSYKQLSLKIFKLKPSQHESSHINHSQVLQTYLYIFQRSNVFIKDLIINILQNVVSNDITSGWQIIYEILNINDSEDKTVVMKVVERLVKEVGYKKLSSLEKLHMILIKEIRVNVGTLTMVEAILNRLWQVSQEINKREIWLQTMKSVKDIYKMSLNNKLLAFFFKICNKCITQQVDENQQRKRRQSFDMMKPILVKQNTKGRQVEIHDQNNLEKQDVIQNESAQSQQISIDRQIYTQLVDWLIFLMDAKNDQSANTKQSGVLIIKEALEHFKVIKSIYIIRYLVGVSGLLNVFTMFIHSEYKIVFLLFFREFLYEKLLCEENGEILILKKSPLKFIQLMGWLVQHFKDSIPSDLLGMRKLDEDFRKQRKDLIYANNQESTQLPILNNQTHKIQLIEFSLSAQDFNTKAISNLILLDCIKMIIKKQTLLALAQKIDNKNSFKSENGIIHKNAIKQTFEKTKTKLYQNLIENYEASRKTNNLIALRNFLWNNGFLLYDTFKENGHENPHKKSSQQQGPVNNNKLIKISKEQKIKSIPGLHKHEKRTLDLILQELPDQENYMMNIQVLEDFIVNYRLKICMDEEKTTNNGLKKRKRQSSVSRVRKISQILKNENNENCDNKKNQTETSQKRAQQQNPNTPTNSKHIQVIQYEKKSTKAPKKQKINVIPSKQAEKSAQNESLIRQLYLNDVQQWISMMEENLNKALRNLQKICSEAVEQRCLSNQAQKLSSFLVNDQEMVKIFLLCLDLSGEQDCSLSIMRNSNKLMQKLLKVVMSVEISYGWKDEDEVQRKSEEDKEQ